MAYNYPKSVVGTTTAATAMSTSAGSLYGVTINAASGSTVTLWDNASAASGTILFQKNFSAATIYQMAFLGGLGIKFANGVTITIAGATAQTTIMVG